MGSTDYDIRVFKNDEIMGELTETEAVTSLTPLQKNCFGYGLSNGTIGVYEKLQRLWRIKVINYQLFVKKLIVVNLVEKQSNNGVQLRH